MDSGTLQWWLKSDAGLAARVATGAAIFVTLAVLASTACCAAALGAAGYAGWLNWVSDDFRMLARENLWRPARLLCVYGIHLGGYVGGAVGTTWAIWRVLRERARLLIE